MKHLTRDELLDAAEGRPVRCEHLDACAACRDEADALARVMAAAASVEVPEPSPLFWDHFSERVSAAVSEERPGRGLLRGILGVRALAAAGAVAGLFVLLVLKPWQPRAVGTPPIASAPVVASRPLAPDRAQAEPAPAGDADEPSWGVLETLAAAAGGDTAVPADEAVLLPGGVDDAVQDLSDSERGELIRLLKVELAQRGVRTEG
jgi:hypothetical protein